MLKSQTTARGFDSDLKAILPRLVALDAVARPMQPAPVGA